MIHEREFVNEEGYHTNSIDSIWAQEKNGDVSNAWSRRKTLRHADIYMYRYNYYANTCIDTIIMLKEEELNMLQSTALRYSTVLPLT